MAEIEESDPLDVKSEETNIKQVGVEDESNESEDDSSSSESDSSSSENSDTVLNENSNNDIANISDEYMSNDSEDECAIFLCNECGKQFNNGASLKAHLAKKHNPRALVNCEFCDSKYRGNFTDHLDSEHSTRNGGYFCKRCNAVCPDYESIIKHRHDKDAYNVCKQCGKIYKSIDNYRLHLLIHENDGEKKRIEKTFSCETCGQKFLLASLLKEHINLHKGMKPYACQICGCCFSTSAALKQHSDTHSSLRPYSCSDCCRAFFRRTDLKKHMRTHTGEKPFVCNICGDSFTQNVHLRAHFSKHKDVRLYFCNNCEKCFVKRGDLIRHIRLHSEEKCYPCSACGIAFRQPLELVAHNKTHHSIVRNKLEQSSVPLAV